MLGIACLTMLSSRPLSVFLKSDRLNLDRGICSDNILTVSCSIFVFVTVFFKIYVPCMYLAVL